jgi:hypothetical protein
MQSILDDAIERYRRERFLPGSQRRFCSTEKRREGVEPRVARPGAVGENGV